MTGLLINKVAAPSPSYSMAGRLYLSESGYILLAVPNALVRGTFDTLDEQGIELPPSGPGGKLDAHITVIRPEELEQIGGADKITERGHSFNYSLGGLKTVVPAGWKEMSKCWMLKVKSPELEKLRKSYGLSKLPERGGKSMDFHITIAVRRKNVLGPNDVQKVSFWLNTALAARAT
jgi:hypothetical protein